MRRIRKGVTELDVIREMLKGWQLSRHSVAAMGVSLPTADRWLEAIRLIIPGARKFKRGRTTWYEWAPTKLMLKKTREARSR